MLGLHRLWVSKQADTGHEDKKNYLEDIDCNKWLDCHECGAPDPQHACDQCFACCRCNSNRKGHKRHWKNGNGHRVDCKQVRDLIKKIILQQQVGDEFGLNDLIALTPCYSALTSYFSN